MDVKLIAATTGLKPKLVRMLEKKGLIIAPPTIEQMAMMQSLSVLMKCTEFVKMTIAPLNPEQRARLLFGAGHSKLEQHIIHRLLHHYADREEAPYNLHHQVVVDEIMDFFKIEEKDRAEITGKVLKLRKKVNNMRRRYPNLVEIAERLTRTKKPTKLQQMETHKKKQTDYQRQNDLFGFN